MVGVQQPDSTIVTTGRAGIRRMRRAARTALLTAELAYHLRRPLTPTRARRDQAQRLAHREDNFLAQARSLIYNHPGMPYHRLLQRAGCAYGDLERLVRQDGLEGALATLLRSGVYLTVDEFKGRAPVVRGSDRFVVEPAALRNQGGSPIHLRQSGGSRGPRTPAAFGIGRQQERSGLSLLALEARGGLGWDHALWGVHEGVQAVTFAYALRGIRIRRFFSFTDPATSNGPQRAGMTAWARMTCSLGGVPVPVPEYVPGDDPARIVQWMQQVRADGRTPFLHTAPSAAVRLAQAARAMGTDLTGVKLSVSGEPMTATRLAAIAAAGGHAVPAYTSSDGPGTAVGCLAPEAIDEVHVPTDLMAAVQPGPDAGSAALPSHALLFSSLTISSPFVLLNVSIGDQGVLVRRDCGCPIGKLGLHTLLHTIRSFEKLTAAGMSFLDANLVAILEEVLPGRFGGGPFDYQIVESEAPGGTPVLELVINPVVGDLDERLVADAFLSAVAGESHRASVLASIWRDAGLPRIVRRVPTMTAAGKVLHVHSSHPPTVAAQRPGETPGS